MSDNCPICLNSYSTGDSHRPISLECGHLFGLTCIKKWFGDRSTVLCPTCQKKSRYRNIRPVYATKVVVNENSEIVAKILKLQEEKKALETENLNLKSTIELLQNELKRDKFPQKITTNVDFTQFKLSRKINYNQKNHMPLMEYDISDNVILITFSNDEIFGLKKIDVLDFMNTEIVFQINYKELLLTNRLPSLSHKRSFTIKDLKISPFSDGTVMICYDKNVIFLNIRNNTVLLDLKMENSITSVEFDKNDRNISYAGDSKGNLIKIDMSGFIESEKISTLPIHSIHMIKNQKIFLGTFKGVFLKDSENCEFFEVSTVTNIFGDDENVIFAIRQPDKTMMHIQIDKNGLDDPNKMFFSFKETRRLRERMHNNLLFVINNEKHSLVLYDTFGTENAVLEVGDEIICCCLGPDAIYVLTVKGFVIFS